MCKATIVTTSWDDGDRADLKLAELLRTRGIHGTFYIPITPYDARPALGHAELRLLSAEGFEIGAHGFSHKHLCRLTTEELAEEINPCKPMLEEILGVEVRMFCYPRVRYDRNVAHALKDAGYSGARTARMLATRMQFKPFEMPVTVQVFPHRKFSYFKNVIRAGRVEGLRAYLANRKSLGNWLELGMSLFDSVLQDGGVWHLTGHSWEIEENGLWQDLARMLDYVCRRQDAIYVSNCDLLQFLPGAKKWEGAADCEVTPSS
jgi:peptidoglycan/xylan/chitin deacetylase (PgdA/CDA1 family)